MIGTTTMNRFEKWNPFLPAILAFVLFVPSLTYGFVFDDHPQVDGNPHLRIWPGLRRALMSDVWLLTDWPTRSNYFRPLFFLSNWFIAHVLSRSSWAFHLVNVVLNVAVVALIWLLSQRLFNDRQIAFTAAVLFAVHPVHTEAVIWIAAIPDLGCTAFFLLALYFYTQWDSSPVLSAGLCTGCLFVAVMWKEPGITFFGVVLAYDILVRREIRWRRYIPILLICGFYFLWRYLALGGFAPIQHQDLQILAPVSALGQYVAKLIVPYPLSLYYPRVTPSAFSLLTLSALIALVLASLRKNREIAWALVWIVVTLSPFLLGSRIPVTFSERNLYLASVGYSLAIALGLSKLKWKYSTMLPIGLIAIFVMLTLVRMPDWHDDLSLYSSTLKRYPDAEIIRLNFATDLTRLGRREDAIRQLDALLEKNPTHLGALENKANLERQKGDWIDARRLCVQVLKSDPNAQSCVMLLADADQEAGNAPAALQRLNGVLQRDPRAASARFNRGNIFAQTGRFDDAIADYKIALAEHPTPEAFNNAGNAYFQSRQVDAALLSYEAALKLDPNFGLARENVNAVLEWLRRHPSEDSRSH